MNTDHCEAYLPRQVLAGLIDGGLVLLACWQWYRSETAEARIEILEGPFMLLIAVLAALIVYRLFCLIVFNKTLGMLLAGIILLNGEEESLNFKEKLLAAVFVLYRGVAYYNRDRTD